MQHEFFWLRLRIFSIIIACESSEKKQGWVMGFLYDWIGNRDRILVLCGKDVIFNEIYAKRKLRIIIYAFFVQQREKSYKNLG